MTAKLMALKNAGRYATVFFVCAVLSSLSSASQGTQSQDLIHLTDSFTAKNIANIVSVYKDSTGSLAVDDILKNKANLKFETSKSNTLNYGYTTDTIWIKFNLNFQASEYDKWYLRLSDPLMDSATLYTIQNNQIVATQNAGEDTPHQQRLVKTRAPSFLITGNTGDAKEYLLRLQSLDPIQVSLTLLSTPSLMETSFTEVIALGAYYGIIAVMLLYNLFIYFTTKEASYLAYCLYLAALLPAQLAFDGLSYQYLWPDSSWWANRSTVFFSGSVALFGTYFARIFLNTNATLPAWDKLLQIHALLALVVMPISLFTSYGFAATCGVSIAVSFASFMLLTALIGFFRNIPNAKYFLFAWLIFTLGLLVRALVATGQIEANIVTMYSAQFGTALETVLLSFALADRIKRIEKEKQQAQQQASEALERSNRELQRSNEIKDEFLAIISHELRTPMNGIQGMLDLLDSTNTDPKQQEYLRYAKLSTGEMLKHIETILCFSEAQSKRIRFKNAPFQLSVLVKTLEEIYDQKCAEKGLTFKINKKPGLPNALEGDEHQLFVILNNLLDNAVKFTDSGKVELSISCEESGSQNSSEANLSFSISDTGCGVPPHLTDAIFKPFMQADTSFSRRHGGLGIGLALSKSLSELMEGKINYLPNEPEGSIFTLRMPMRIGDERDVNSFANRASTAPISPKPNAPTILIVEDNLVNQKVLSAILKKKDYQILTALNGENAISCLNENKIDLILMDCQMPIMDGFEASKIIRERKSRYGYPPIIAVTANAMSEDREKCINAGMNDYLSKPVDRNKLYETIEAWLNYQSTNNKTSA